MVDESNPLDPIPSELVQEDGTFAELVQDFIDGLHGRMAEITRAVAANDYAALRSLAKQLKSATGGQAYPDITQQAADLEQHALQQEIDAIERDLLTLQDLVARVVLRY
jgi:HPt (histidine-containing phosphotransfer) domain-containing protein